MARNDDEDLTEEYIEEPDADADAEAEPEEEYEEELRGPRPRVTILTMLLAVLNVLAAGAFAFLLLMDYSKRQAYSYAVFQHDYAVVGLPLEMESPEPAASRETFPRQNLSAEELKAAMSLRNVKGSGDIWPAELAVTPILPEHLTPEILKDLFKDAGEPVKTLDEEIKRLKTTLPDSIAAAANEMAADAKTEADKRRLLQKLLLSMSYSVQQVQAVDKTIKNIPDSELDGKLKEAAQRRYLVNILLPLDLERPAERSDRMLEQAATLDSQSLDQLNNLLLRRMDALLADKFDPALHFGKDWADQKRDAGDRRQAIAYFLLTISQVKKQDGAALYPANRLQTIVGLHQYALAAQALSAALVSFHARLLDAVKTDREGAVFQGKDAVDRTAGFIDEYQDELQRIRNLLQVIKTKQERLDDMQLRVKGHEKGIEERAAQVKDVTARIKMARAETAKLFRDLERLQGEFFKAKLRLRDAQQENLKREQRIQALEGLEGKAGTP